MKSYNNLGNHDSTQTSLNRLFALLPSGLPGPDLYGLSGPWQFIIVKPRSEGYGIPTVGKVQTYDSILI